MKRITKRRLLIPVVIPMFTLAWLLHGLSEWSYNAADWIYKKLGTNIFEANIMWHK